MPRFDFETSSLNLTYEKGHFRFGTYSVFPVRFYESSEGKMARFAFIDEEKNELLLLYSNLPEDDKNRIIKGELHSRNVAIMDIEPLGETEYLRKKLEELKRSE